MLDIPTVEIDLDSWVRAVVRWHFDPATASPFWLRHVPSLGFDPLAAVLGVADLRLFPDLSAELRTSPVNDLIPQGCRAMGGPFWAWESGGRSGAPRRIATGAQHAAEIDRLATALGRHAFPGHAGNWLHVGPAGPHDTGHTVGLLAQRYGQLCHFLDFDPLWVRRLVAAGQQVERDLYIRHVADQALMLLVAQPVAVLVCTAPLLEALCRHGPGLGLLRRLVRAVIWYGDPVPEETLRLWQEDWLPLACLVGWYTETLLGVACQRPRRPGEPHRAVFHPPYPTAHVRLVDSGGNEVSYGETGRVVVSALRPELFLPNALRRDQAVRVAPPAGYHSDGLARISLKT